MTPIQQMFLGVGAKKKTYMDDVFSTFLWRGNGSNSATRTMANGVDLAGEGGMVWVKQRTGANDARIIDTVRGNAAVNGVANKAPYYVMPSSTGAQGDRNWQWTYLNNGFSFNQDYGDINGNNEDYTSWTFRKAPGFFDVVTYTGNGTSGKQIAHNLGSIPGFIMIKRTDASGNWNCYHTKWSVDGTRLLLNDDEGGDDFGTLRFDVSTVNSTHFSIGSQDEMNANNGTFVAYVFAGGDPVGYGSVSLTSDTSATTGNRLKTNSHNDYAMHTNPFTIECWFKIDGNTGAYNTLLTTRQSNSDNGGDGWSLITSNNHVYFFDGAWVFGDDISASDGNWHHVAVVREGTGSNQTKLYCDGVQKQLGICPRSFTRKVIGIGDTVDSQNEVLWGHISNVRITKGQAIYTSSFTPSTTPLTPTSQGANQNSVQLLCCNDINIRKFTHSTGGLIPFGSGTVGQAASPFTTPASYNLSRIFGENGDQDVIKCGRYKADSGDDTHVNLGWEPQFIMIKCVDQATTNWSMYDSMRGIVDGSNESYLYPNLSAAEYSADRMTLTPTGFIIKQNGGVLVSANNKNYIYVAIRRPDPLVQKPSELGTDVFTMDTGNSSTTIPAFDSGFPVDFQLNTKPGSTWDKYAGSRLTQGKYLATNSAGAESSSSEFVYDSNVGWSKGSGNNSSYQSWMWKRHAGFDVVTYKGNGTFGHVVNHSMNKSPEMIWLKERDSAVNWYVNHTALTGGGAYASWRGALKLNGTNAAWESANVLGDFSTSTTFTLGSDTDINGNGDDYIAMLFASVDGISSVGSYDGSSSDVTVTTGFQPRFVIIKAVNNTRGWTVMDTTRGWGSGVDNKIMLNDNGAQVNTWDYGTPTSTGFTVSHSQYDINYTGWKYIYYAHA